jgi:hypothetical protein
MDHQAFAQILGNYGEFFGAVAVVATLGYLAVQISHSNRTTIATTTLEVVKLVNEINHEMVTNSEFQRLFTVGCNDPDSLSDEETVAAGLVIRNYMNVWFAAHIINKSGGIDKEMWDVMHQSFGGIAATRGGHKFVAENTDTFNDEFIRLMSRPVRTEIAGYAFSTRSQ